MMKAREREREEKHTEQSFNYFLFKIKEFYSKRDKQNGMNEE